jgi:hypothetical protein
MTEAEIEREVERKMDSLDRLLLSGEISQEHYGREVRALDMWAAHQYECGGTDWDYENESL